MPAMDQKRSPKIKQLEAEDRTDDPRYMAAARPMHYEQHVLRMPPDRSGPIP